MPTVDHHDIDRGWAWVAAVAAYLTMIIKCLTLYMGGVLYIALLETFNDGKAKTSLVSAINSGLLCFLAPLAGIFINKFSSRVSIIVGGILGSTGLACSAFCNGLDGVIITAGVLLGIGFALTTAGIIVNLGYYFQKRRNLMITIMFVMPGFGMFASSPFGLIILDKYGLSSSFLIVAAVYAHTCIFGMLCKPSSLELEFHKQRKIKTADCDKNKRSNFNISLLLNKAFLCFLLSSCTWNFALVAALMHLPNYLKVRGGTDSDIGWLMTSFAIANTTGRFSGTIFNTHKKIDTLTIHILFVAVGGIITIFFPLYSQQKIGQFAFSILLGMCCGCPNAIMTTLSIKFVGVAMLPEANGLSYFFSGVGVSAGSVVTGYLFGLTGSYSYSFIVAGFVLVLGSIFGITASLLLRCGKDTKMKSDVSMDTSEHKSMLSSNGMIEEYIELTPEKVNVGHTDV